MTLKQAIQHIGIVFGREIRRISRSPLYLFCILGAPLLCTIFFISLMREGLPTDLPIAVVDLDNSATSRNLIRQLDAFEQTKVVVRTASFSEARIEMQ